MGLCLLSKRQQRRGGPDLCWQTVPHPRRCHRKGAVAKSYPTSWRHQQRSRVGRATGDKLWCRHMCHYCIWLSHRKGIRPVNKFCVGMFVVTIWILHVIPLVVTTTSIGLVVVKSGTGECLCPSDVTNKSFRNLQYTIGCRFARC